MNYTYQIVDPMSYDDWAQAAYEVGTVPLLPMDKHGRLVSIFEHKGECTPVMHKDNIAWLERLQLELVYVWSSVQRRDSRMLQLVEDYKAQFAL